MTMTDMMVEGGWQLTAQGYIKGPWRIYHAETWCAAFRDYLVRGKFPDELTAAQWIDGEVF